MSHRVGVCRKHLANDFTETTLTLTEWRESDFAKNHIADIWERRRREADREDLKSELKPRRDEGVHQERRTDDQRLYVVTVVGLTREDAINIYKMADSIRAERES